MRSAFADAGRICQIATILATSRGAWEANEERNPPMADLDGLKVAHDYHVDTPFANDKGFYVKGANSLDLSLIHI